MLKTHGSTKETKARIELYRSKPTIEFLEARCLLTFAASFPNGGALTPRTDANASATSSLTEGEVVIAISRGDPLELATYAVDGTNFDSDTSWYSEDGGVSWTASNDDPTPEDLTSGGDPAAAFDRSGGRH
jgi:hypothetical protein